MRVPNLLRRTVIAATALAQIACADPPDREPDADAAAQLGEAQPLPSALPPPSADRPRYVGLWAANAEGCADPAWRFEDRGLSTEGEVSCTFNTISLVETGYAIDATCTAEAPPEPYRIQLSFAESARVMMITGGPWDSPPALVYCGPVSSG